MDAMEVIVVCSSVEEFVLPAVCLGFHAPVAPTVVANKIIYLSPTCCNLATELTPAEPSVDDLHAGTEQLESGHGRKKKKKRKWSGPAKGWHTLQVWYM